jgi:hypothetical protein
VRIFTKKRVIVVLGLVGAMAIAGVAVAYWTGGGSGSGSAGVGTSGSVTLTGTVSPGISPGTSKPVSFTAANATTSPIRVTTVHLDSVAVDAGHSTCVTADFTMADVTENHQVPAGATVEPLPTNGSLVYANTAVNQDACKNATLTLTLSSI